MAEDSRNENMAIFLAKTNDATKYSSYHPIPVPIKVDQTVMSENAIKLIRTIEKNLASKTECFKRKAEHQGPSHKIKVKKDDTWNENESQSDSPEGRTNEIMERFTGTDLASVPKYIYGPKPPKKPGLFDCNKCGEGFKALASLHRHNINHHVEKNHNPNKPVICDICDKGFRDFQALTSHRNAKHMMLNPLYESTTISSDKINKNKEVKQKIKCADVLVPDITIKVGNLEHSAEKSDVLPKSIFGLEHPTNEGFFSCHKCGKNLASQECLDRHKLEIHKRKRKRYKPKKTVCDICHREFESFKCMMEHKSHLHGPFSCNICGQTFLLGKALGLHLKYGHTSLPEKCST